jgi:hypothetical protein
MTDSMRDQLTAAMESQAKDDDTQDYDETTQEVLGDDDEAENEAVEAKPATDTELKDMAAEEPYSSKADDENTADKGAVAAKDAVDKDKVSGEEDKGHGDSIKAPMDWGPKDRESWSKIPRHLQEKVMSREKELNTMLQTTADARKTHDQFGQLSTQYGSVLSDMGNTPMEAVGNLFNTVASLKMGSPIQKAQIMADLIGQFGVDINTLDSALVNEAPSQESQQNGQFEQMLQERMKPYEAMLAQQTQQTNYAKKQKSQEALTEVQAFAKTAEFLNDVKPEMADLIDMAYKRGVNMPLQQAYDIACSSHPEISSMIAERKQIAGVNGGNAALQAKKNAASSINGRKSGVGGPPDLGLREQLSDSWDNAGRI